MREIATSLKTETIQTIERIAEENEISVAAVMRQMISERIKEIASKNPGDQPMKQGSQKARLSKGALTMTIYSQSYKTISMALLKTNEKLIKEWSNGSDRELAEACRMVIAAAQGAKP